jgi:hypothetical protein
MSGWRTLNSGSECGNHRTNVPTRSKTHYPVRRGLTERFAPRCPVAVERCTAEDPPLHVPVAGLAAATTSAGAAVSALPTASAGAGTSAEAAASTHEAACLLV